MTKKLSEFTFNQLKPANILHFCVCFTFLMINKLSYLTKCSVFKYKNPLVFEIEGKKQQRRAPVYANFLSSQIMSLDLKFNTN